MAQRADKGTAWARGAGLVATVLLVLALLIAPVAMVLSHGPGSVHPAQNAELSDQGLGHPHAEEDAGQHDSTDHEHQVTAILPASGKTVFGRQPPLLLRNAAVKSGRSRDGPRRPPRAVLT